MYFYYKLSKGIENGNTSGYLDLALNYLSSISKELQALKNKISVNSYEPFIESLLSLKENRAKKIVPDVDTLIIIHLDNWIVNPEGALVRWYNELQADWKSLGKQLMKSVFEDIEFIAFLGPANLDVKKLNSSLTKHLDELTDNFITENNAYKTRLDKSLLQIISEENCETALVHLKNFNYPYIKLTSPPKVPKKVFAGYQIENNPDTMEKIGYDQNDFNDIMIDSPQFRHKIVKIVFFTKLSFGDYFMYKAMVQAFEKEFAQKRRNGASVPCPFIHKAFEGSNFEGNVYEVLSSCAAERINPDGFTK